MTLARTVEEEKTLPHPTCSGAYTVDPNRPFASTGQYKRAPPLTLTRARVNTRSRQQLPCSNPPTAGRPGSSSRLRSSAMTSLPDSLSGRPGHSSTEGPASWFFLIQRLAPAAAPDPRRLAAPTASTWAGHASSSPSSMFRASSCRGWFWILGRRALRRLH